MAPDQVTNGAVADAAAARTVARAAQVARVELPRRPLLAPWATVVDLGDDRLQLRGAELAYTLRHPFLIGLFRAVEPLLDGARTVEEIAAAGPPEFEETTVVFLLKLLEANGLLQAGPGSGDATADLRPWERQLRFLAHFVPDAAAAQTTLLDARVRVAGDGSVAAAVASALGTVGVAAFADAAVPTADELEGTDLVVACSDSPGYAFFDAVNRACLDTRTRWLRAAVVATAGQLGPTMLPGQTCCYTCFDLRTQAHVSDLDGLAAYRGHTAPADEGALGPLVATLAAEAALEAARLLTGFAPPATVGRFYELVASTPARVGHDVLKVPRCPSCSVVQGPREPWDLALQPNAGNNVVLGGGS